MSKNVKRILCGTLALGTLCCTGAISPENMFTTKAEAYTISVDAGEIKTMTVKTIEGEELDFVNNFDDCEIIEYDGNDREFYVIMPDDSDGVRLSVSVKQKDNDDDDDYFTARIFTSSSDSASAFETGDDIDIDGAGQTLYVRVYRSEKKFKDARKDGEVSKCYETYKVTVKRESADLDDLNKDTSGIVSNTENIKLPHIDTNLTVETKTYKNEWVQKGNYWIRYNENGEPLRNAWFQDGSGKWYYLQSNSYMTTGWRYIDGKWYYFDKGGAMQTGWIQTTEGEWYYLLSDGTMAKNTTIDGYKLGMNGQYVK